MIPQVNFVVNDNGKPVYVQMPVQEWEALMKDYNRLKNLASLSHKFKKAFKEIRQIQAGQQKGTTLNAFLDEL